VNLYLDSLLQSDMPKVRKWRNGSMYALRTPIMLTEGMQEDFFHTQDHDRHTTDRYFAIRKGDRLIGQGGLTNIEWENRIAEISLIMDPKLRGKGYGRRSADLLLAYGFNTLNLENIYGEVYTCNRAIGFWETIAKGYNGYMTRLPGRKYWNGWYWDSIYFNVNRSGFIKVAETTSHTPDNSISGRVAWLLNGNRCTNSRAGALVNRGERR